MQWYPDGQTTMELWAAPDLMVRLLLPLAIGFRAWQKLWIKSWFDAVLNLKDLCEEQGQLCSRRAAR